MIGLLPLGKVITTIAVIYASITCLIFWISHNEATSCIYAISIAFSGSAFLNLFLLGVFYLGWQKLWDIIPQLNKLLFPNLNGVWDMEIHWEREGIDGTSKAKAVIKQDFLKLGMDVDADDSYSQTLIAVPKKDSESGSPLLYYVFLTTPKNRFGIENHAPYTGAAILKVSADSKDYLQGNYFTSRKSNGHYELSRSDT